MAEQEPQRRGKKGEAAFRTISEVAEELDIPQHVLRFWETKFTQVRPLKRGGGRRYYRPEDVALLKRIRVLLYDDGLTIKGVQKLFKDSGLKAVLEGGAVLGARAPQSEASTDQDVAAVVRLLKDARDRLRTSLSETSA